MRNGAKLADFCVFGPKFWLITLNLSLNMDNSHHVDTFSIWNFQNWPITADLRNFFQTLKLHDPHGIENSVCWVICRVPKLQEPNNDSSMSRKEQALNLAFIHPKSLARPLFKVTIWWLVCIYCFLARTGNATRTREKEMKWNELEGERKKSYKTYTLSISDELPLLVSSFFPLQYTVKEKDGRKEGKGRGDKGEAVESGARVTRWALLNTL